MENKNYYLDMWTHWVWSYNYVYEDKLEHCPFLDETEDTLDLLEAYCKIIIAEGKRRKKSHSKDNNDYNNYSATVQDAIQNVIRLLSDGRDMHLTIKVEDPELPLKTFNHHLCPNGLLPFENDPFDDAKRILDDIPKVREIVNSEKMTGDFGKFINNGKWYFFEGYESGSIAVKFSKINYTSKEEWTFDGDLVCFETVNGRCDGDGIIVHQDVTNMSFEELPYYDDEIEDAEDLISWIDNAEKIYTPEELKKAVYDSIDWCLDEII